MRKIEHIYIHWPFCKSKCDYCDFLSFSCSNNLFKEYHKALCDHIINFHFDYMNEQQSLIKTIFLGGGTPSLYPIHLLNDLFNCLNNNFNLSHLKEVTIETNPGDITYEKLKAWSEIGINRLSMGVQILDDDILKNVKRIQSKFQVLKALEIASEYFKNLSIDLILGLPGTNKKIWMQTLKSLIKFPIKHISIYLLTIYNKTPLFFNLKNKKISLLSDDEILSLYQITVDFLKNNGFEQYEISNFSKKGFESEHNLAYWERKPYFGFGLGASSFDGFYRYINEKNIDKFLQNSKKHKNSWFLKEKLTKKQNYLESLMLGLRLKKGVDLHHMLYSLEQHEKTRFLNSLDALKKGLLIQEKNGKIYLTLKGMMLENEIILKLI